MSGLLRRSLLSARRHLFVVSGAFAAACGTSSPEGADVRTPADAFATARERMVRTIRVYGCEDEAVLAVMSRVARHEFVPEDVRAIAYQDSSLPIGHQQTISQPFIVAFMTAALRPKRSDKVLEIGTGSGYQAAVLAGLVDHVYTIEIVEPLARCAEATLRRLGHRNVSVRAGDGYRGWPEAAPFDAIMVTAAPDHVPQPLVDQLKVGGRMILPVGDHMQQLVLIEKGEQGITRKSVLDVRFVPMTGEARRR
jgi:protein-L-isoaspartate(D-aspartate) O-methyltransferase